MLRRASVLGGAMWFVCILQSPVHGQGDAPKCTPLPNASMRDTIDLLHNSTGIKASGLVRGQRAQCLETPQFIELRQTETIDNLLVGTPQCRDEISLFVPDRGMQFVDDPTCFTDGGDLISFDVRVGSIELPVKAWSVGAARDVPNRALADAAWANERLADVGCGIALMKPALASAKLPSAITCTALKTEVGFDPQTLNVYYLPGSAGARGFECLDDPDMLVIGDGSGGDTLAHEVGHALHLGHVSNDIYNIMAEQSYQREEFTIAQCMIANVDEASFVQRHQRRRAPRVPRSCNGLGSATCPRVPCASCNPRLLRDVIRVPALLEAVEPLLMESGVGSVDLLTAKTPETVQQWQTILASGVPADLRADRVAYLRRSFYRMKLYEVGHPAWALPYSESQYVNSYLTRDLLRIRLAALDAIHEARPNEADRLIEDARQRGAKAGTLSKDVARVIARRRLQKD